MSLGAKAEDKGDRAMTTATAGPVESTTGSDALSRRELFAMLCGRGAAGGDEDHRFAYALRRSRRAAVEQASLQSPGNGVSAFERLLKRVSTINNGERSGEIQTRGNV
jgi:hypothetical protein